MQAAGRAAPTTPEAAAVAVRAVRRRELLRIACGELVGRHRRGASSGRALSRLTDATLQADARHRHGVGAAPARPRRGADPDRGGRDGPLRRLRAVLRQRRRRDVRARARRGRRGRRSRRRSPRRWSRELRRLLSLPAQRPAARGRRRPAARRARTARWCAPWSPTPPTTPSGRTCGSSRRCCAPTPVVGDEELRARFTELIDPLRFPAEGDLRGRRGRGTPDQGPRRRRAAAARRRPRRPTSSSGRGGLADVEWTVQLLQMRHAGRVPRRCGRRRRCPRWRPPPRPS